MLDKENPKKQKNLKKEKDKMNNNIIKLENVSIQFPHLAKTKTQNFDDGTSSEYYSATFLIKKDDVKKWSKIKEAEREFSYDSLGYETDTLLKDGDEKRIDFLADCFYLNTKSKYKPQVIDSEKNVLTEEEIIKKVRRGAKVNAIIQLHKYNINGKKGISAYILAVQVLDKTFSRKNFDFTSMF